MSPYLKPLAVLSIIVLVLSPAFADDSQGEKTTPSAFTDFDGDGIRDDAQDTNNDGIPDLGEPREEPSKDNSPTETGLFYSEAAQEEVEKSLLSERDKFQKRKFAVRGHSQNRGDFGTGGFGPDEGMSSAVSSACPGGVCH